MSRAFSIASVLWPLLLASCTELATCENTGVQRLTSPDGELDVVAFERDCGATTDRSYHVSVLPAGDSLSDEGGNTFVASRPENRTTLVQRPLIGWLGDSVQIFYVAPREVYKREERAAGRAVAYDTGDGYDIVR